MSTPFYANAGTQYASSYFPQHFDDVTETAVYIDKQRHRKLSIYKTASKTNTYPTQKITPSSIQCIPTLF